MTGGGGANEDVGRRGRRMGRVYAEAAPPATNGGAAASSAPASPPCVSTPYCHPGNNFRAASPPSHAAWGCCRAACSGVRRAIEVGSAFWRGCGPLPTGPCARVRPCTPLASASSFSPTSCEGIPQTAPGPGSPDPAGHSPGHCPPGAADPFADFDFDPKPRLILVPLSLLPSASLPALGFCLHVSSSHRFCHTPSCLSGPELSLSQQASS